MEEKNSSASLSPANMEAEFLVSPVVHQEATGTAGSNMEAEFLASPVVHQEATGTAGSYMEAEFLASPVVQQEATGTAGSNMEAEFLASPVVHQEATGTTGSASTGTEITVKRKRGRPKKSDADASTDSRLVSLPPDLLSSFSSGCVKRGRGRPKGTGKLQLLASLGGIAADTAGGSFTPYVLTVLTGECIGRKIQAFTHRGPCVLCILSAAGVVSSVVIRQPNSPGSTLRYEGRFDILTLSGSFTTGGKGSGYCTMGILSVSLAKPDGQVFGGGVAGPLIAAGPTQIVVATFKPNICKELKRRSSAESSTAISVLGNSDILRVPLQSARVTDDENCPTPTSAPLAPSHAGEDNVIAGIQNLDPSSQQTADENTLQPLQPMLDQRSSPHINGGEPQI